MVRPPPCFALHVVLSALSPGKFSFQLPKGIFVAQLVDVKQKMKQESLFQDCSPETVQKAADAGHLT